VTDRERTITNPVLNFYKMHGIGNDFIVVHTTGFDAPLPDARTAPKLCDRRFGIGADGVLIIGPSTTADHRVIIYNSDGSTAEMCGNGIRCCALYVRLLGLAKKPLLVFETGAGPVPVEALAGGNFRVGMGAPILAAGKIPTAQSSGRVVMHELALESGRVSLTAVSMGNPHAVVQVDDPTDDLVHTLGPAIERHPFFPARTNVEFVKVLSESEIRMRVWERGCGETLACGTGACAAVVAGVLCGKNGGAVTVHLPGGDLSVEWNGRDNGPVYLTGPAAVSFTGSVVLSP
jgi:diaminopimelate epimerase